MGLDFSDLPFNEAEWIPGDDDGNGNIDKKLSFNTSKTQYLSKDYSYIPLKTEVENGIMFEVYTDRGFVEYDASNITTEGKLPELFWFYSAGPVGDDHGITKWGNSGVRGFSVSGDRMVVAGREDGYNYPTLRFYYNDDDNQFDLTDSVAYFRDVNLTSGTFRTLEDCIINGDYVYALSDEIKLWVFNATNWNDPKIMSNLTITDAVRPAYMQIENNMLYFFDGEKEIHVINITNPGDPSVLSNSIKCPAIVQDMAIKNNRVYIAGGKRGLWVYNISDPLDISLLTSYNNTIEDAYTLLPYNNTAVYVGNINGTVQLLNVDDNKEITDLIHFGDDSCATLHLWNNLLFVGTSGYYTQVFNISDPLNPVYITSNSRNIPIGSSEDYIFFIQNFLDNSAEEGSKCPRFQMYINFFADDWSNTTRRYDARVFPNYLILYNDTNQDGLLTLNVSRDQIAKDYVKSYGFLDDIYAMSSFNCSSYDYTDPIARYYEGIPSLYFNITWYSWSLLAQSERMYGLPKGFSIVGNNDLNVSFDLTYGFWFIPLSNYTFKIKIETSLKNINMEFGTQPIPTNLKLYSGYLTSINTIYGTTSLPISTQINNDTLAQQFGSKGNVIALSTMQNWYLRNKTNNGEEQLNETCIKSAIPDYIDGDNQKVIGDSAHIYRWVLGANFHIDNKTTSIFYDPDTTYFTSEPGSEGGGEDGGDDGPPVIPGYSVIVLIGMTGIAILIIAELHLNSWRKIK